MTDNNISKIPTIFVDSSSVASRTLFNSNRWEGQSRGVVQSCATEHSVICYGVERLTTVCKNADKHCAYHLTTLQELWKKAPWDLSKGIYFAEVPEIHLLIEAFFAGTKSLLDLIVQLLSTEGVVGVDLDGFHRAGDVYGGRVLNALDRNTKAEKKAVAQAFKALINEHKANWIDDIIHTRDFLVHPTSYANQLMFEIRLTSKNGNLVCNSLVPPHVGHIPISQYAQQELMNVDRFAGAFLAALVNDRSAA